MSKKLYLPCSVSCFVCGNENPRGLGVTFYTLDDDNKVFVDFKPDDCFNSYRNVAHGGILSAVLDEAMGWAAFIYSDYERFLFTRELTVTYKKNVPLEEPLLVTTEFVGNERGGMVSTKGKLTNQNGVLFTSAKGLFFPVAPEKMEETKQYLRFDDNLEYHPKALALCR